MTDLPAPPPTGNVRSGAAGASAPPTGGELLNAASRIRDDAQALHVDATGAWLQLRLADLDERTAAAALRAPHDLLRDLSRDRGLSWASIARLAGVTPTAIRKWRRGEPITAENRRALARIVALLGTIGDLSSPLEEPSTWLEMPISDAATLTPSDLFVAGRADLLVQLATGRVRAHAVLEAFDADWRTRYAADERFDVRPATDGGFSIVERG